LLYKKAIHPHPTHWATPFTFLEDGVFSPKYDKFNDRIATLAGFPELGTVLSDEEYTIVKQGYRFIVVHPYLIFYRITNEAVIIHRILHGRRDYLRELFTT